MVGRAHARQCTTCESLFYSFKMYNGAHFFPLTLFLLLSVSVFGGAEKIVETIDHEGKYRVEWEVDFRNESIVFDITVETTGYVGFGISNQGGMTGADIVIAGVLPDGTAYIRVRNWHIDIQRVFLRKCIKVLEHSGLEYFQSTYFPCSMQDFHGTGNNMPERDDHEDWALLHASENSTHTSLKILRKLQTCDLQDVAITVRLFLMFYKRFSRGLLDY